MYLVMCTGNKIKKKIFHWIVVSHYLSIMISHMVIKIFTFYGDSQLIIYKKKKKKKKTTINHHYYIHWMINLFITFYIYLIYYFRYISFVILFIYLVTKVRIFALLYTKLYNNYIWRQCLALMWTYNGKIKQKSKNGVRPDQESMAKENKLQSQPIAKLYK